MQLHRPHTLHLGKNEGLRPQPDRPGSIPHRGLVADSILESVPDDNVREVWNGAALDAKQQGPFQSIARVACGEWKLVLGSTFY